MGNDIPKENWLCYENRWKNHPQIYLEECKYKIKKTQTSRFINTELKSDSDSGSELELDLETKSKSDTELMSKLKCDCDSE